MPEKIDDLFKVLDEAYEKGDSSAVEVIGRKILSAMVEGEEKEEREEKEHKVYEFIGDFLSKIKNKPVYKYLTKAVKGNIDEDATLIKLLSSLVTHMVIECETVDNKLGDYPIEETLNMIQGLVKGTTKRGEVIEFLRARYGELM